MLHMYTWHSTYWLYGWVHLLGLSVLRSVLEVSCAWDTIVSGSPISCTGDVAWWEELASTCNRCAPLENFLPLRPPQWCPPHLPCCTLLVHLGGTVWGQELHLTLWKSGSFMMTTKVSQNVCTLGTNPKLPCYVSWSAIFNWIDPSNHNFSMALTRLGQRFLVQRRGALS